MKVGIKSRGLTRIQVLVCAVVGGIAGIYIWRPLFRERLQIQIREAEEQKKGKSEDLVGEE